MDSSQYLKSDSSLDIERKVSSPLRKDSYYLKFNKQHPYANPGTTRLKQLPLSKLVPNEATVQSTLPSLVEGMRQPGKRKFNSTKLVSLPTRDFNKGKVKKIDYVLKHSSKYLNQILDKQVQPTINLNSGTPIAQINEKLKDTSISTYSLKKAISDLPKPKDRKPYFRLKKFPLAHSRNDRKTFDSNKTASTPHLKDSFSKISIEDNQISTETSQRESRINRIDMKNKRTIKKLLQKINLHKANFDSKFKIVMKRFKS